jgi:hypothetical protein
MKRALILKTENLSQPEHAADMDEDSKSEDQSDEDKQQSESKLDTA